MEPEEQPIESAIEVEDVEALDLSPSVAKLIQSFAPDEKVEALDLVRALLKTHLHYGQNGAGAKLRDLEASVSKAESRPVEDWVRQVDQLYRPETTLELHGRLIILGLSLLDENLARQLSANAFLYAVVQEISDPVDSLLTSEALPLWQHLRRLITPESGAVPTHTDYPTMVDQLGRRGFAEGLAERMRRIRERQDGAFLLHIHGPWGSGKTSVLNFLSASLKGESDAGTPSEFPGWVVVDFNAWQHQRIEAPWWSLMDAVFRDAVSQMNNRRRAGWLWIWEHVWRLKTGRLHYYIAIAVFFWALAVLLWIATREPGAEPTSLDTMAGYAKAFSGTIALIATVWGIILGLTRSLLPGSARAARSFIDSTRDPLRHLAKHFTQLVDRIEQPVAILIDDLDRCQGSYAVELLEGIQTLFNKADVTYVIAADRRWLCTSYEEAYKAFAKSVTEPGRDLGNLFLEKTFQFSVSLPRLLPDLQSQYWQHLISIGADQSEQQAMLEQARRDAGQRVQQMASEEDALAELRRDDLDAVQMQALREAVVVRLAAPDVEAQVQHTLEPFAPLLEPNPRAMKRLVNAYGVQRMVDILRGGRTEPRRLALWTIVVMRWPRLAKYLERNPEMVAHVGSGALPEDKIDEELVKLVELFRDEEVRRVVHGEGDEGPLVEAPLDEEDIRGLTGLRTTDTSVRVVA
jgi:hypothetical protein